MLVNAIRYQCSLGLDDKGLKGRVIRACMNDISFRNDLKTRLHQVRELLSVRQYVNASGGVCEDFVNKALAGLNVECRRIIHPSRWGCDTKCKES